MSTLRLPQNPGIGGLEELTSAEETFLTGLAGITYSNGDILYASGGFLTNLGIGTEDQVITSKSGIPSWEDSTGGTDEKVKYDASDPIAGYVADKFVAGTGITLAEGTGANENKLLITNSLDLSGYVPYTGAIADLNLGDYNLLAEGAVSHDSHGFYFKNQSLANVASFGLGGGQNWTFYDGVKLNGGTASRVLLTDSSKNISYSTLTSAELEAIPTTYAKLDGTNQPFTGGIEVSKSGTAKATTDFLTLTNTRKAVDMDGTGTGILFNQWYYNAVTPALADSGRISVITETDWTSTASTQDSAMIFSTALDGTVSEKMRITSAGYVGIGTATPGITGYETKLHVYGTGTGVTGRTLLLAENNQASAGAIITARNDLGNHASFQMFGSNFNVGNTLGLNNQAAFGSITGLVIFSDSDVASGGTNPISFRTGGYNVAQERMRIASDGKVGIGTTTPLTLFEVYGATGGLTLTRNSDVVADEPFVLFRKGSTPSTIAQIRGIHGGGLRFTNGASDVEWARFTSAGFMGIGTGVTASARLHAISTTEQLRLGYDASNYLSATVGSTGSITFALTGTTPKFTFSQAVKLSTLTSGRIPFATTGGELVDDADLTFATDTLTATKIVGTTSIKVGTAAGYISSDGSTGATGSFTTVDLKTVTVKDGIITSIV